MNRRRILLLGAASALAGCSTRRLNSAEVYEEKLDSLAISPSGDTLVVLGSSFHYVLNPPPQLIAALRSDLRRQLSADFQPFELDSPTDIRGEWRLLLAAGSLQPDAAELARSLGFAADHLGGYTLTGKIRGKRYTKRSLKMPLDVEKTNSQYSISVGQSTSYYTATAHTQGSPILSSPVASNVDGKLILGAIVLLPLLLILKPCIACK